MDPITGISLTPFPAGVDSTLLGTAGNDTITGDTGNDRVFGRAGNDILAGGSGNDTIFGGRGNDTLLGGDGNDSLVGDRNNDLLVGGNGDDQLIGVSLSATTFGQGEVDTLTGGEGADIFFLGDSTRAYYDSGTGGLGLADYALITDFSLTTDFIQLIPRVAYLVGALSGTAPTGFPTGAVIFINRDGVPGISANDEVVAVLPGFTSADAAAITSRFLF